MVALLIYAYARGNRSSRGIERACFEDVAYRVICAQLTPDHSTIAEFRRRHELELGEPFVQVLGLCREAGLVSVGVLAIDGTKIRRRNARLRPSLHDAEILTINGPSWRLRGRGDLLADNIKTAETDGNGATDTPRQPRRGPQRGPQDAD